MRLSIDAGALALDDVSTGDSIGCNGVCLTVVDKTADTFAVDVSPETLSCTVGLSTPGPVNLEKPRPCRPSWRPSGVGPRRRRRRGRPLRPLGDNRLLEIRAPDALSRYIARKGSITVNGVVSLTTNTVDGASFSINLIPHTLAATTLGELKPGSPVNLEVDLIARYVERMLHSDTPEGH